MYCIKKASTIELKGLWDGPLWRTANELQVKTFHRRSKSRHPDVRAKLLYTDDGLMVHFLVQDQYVRCVDTNFQGSVCRDSCVEFFVEPKPGLGYFNFEINCGGHLHVTYIEDPTVLPEGGFSRYTVIPWEHGKQVQIYHNLPEYIEPELSCPVTWHIEYFAPFSFFETYVGRLGKLKGSQWRANFYKCADLTSHPHWISWAPIGERCAFHVPEHFAPLTFA